MALVNQAAEMVDAALVAPGRVRSDQSELAELWAEAEDTAWSDSLTQIEAVSELQPPAAFGDARLN